MKTPQQIEQEYTYSFAPNVEEKAILAFIHKIREEDRKAFLEMIPEERKGEVVEIDGETKILRMMCCDYTFNACRKELLDKLNNL